MIVDTEKREVIKRLAKKVRNDEYYTKNKEDNKIDCVVCACKVNKYYFEKHEQTKRHKKWADLQARAAL